MTLGEDYRAKYRFASHSGVGFTGELRTCEATSVDGGKQLITVRLLASALVVSDRLEALLAAASMGVGATIEIRFQAEGAK